MQEKTKEQIEAEKSAAALPPGFNKLEVPKGCGNVSFDGREYSPDKNGYIAVPDAAVPVLVGQGFRKVA